MNDDRTSPRLDPSEGVAPHRLLEAEREMTSARLTGLVDHLDAIIESSALSVSDDEHDPEGATLGFERAQVTALVNEARHHLDAVDRALDRLRAGTYGVCESCGRPIGRDRSVALPVAVNCVDCAAGGAGGAGRISSRG